MTEGISGTAYQLYQQPDPLRDEPEEHSWDREIDRLREVDEAKTAMAERLYKQGGLNFWELPEEDQRWLMDQVDAWRGGDKTYCEAVALFLARRKAETEVDAFVADCEERLRRIDEHRTEC